MSRWWLLGLAIGIGVTVVAAESLLFSALTGRPLVFARDVEPVNAVLVAIPYLLLAALDVRRPLPWLAGLFFTLSLWGYALYSGVSYQWNPDGSGADIGLGLLTIFSPIFISGAVLAANALQRKRSSR